MIALFLNFTIILMFTYSENMEIFTVQFQGVHEVGSQLGEKWGSNRKRASIVLVMSFFV